MPRIRFRPYGVWAEVAKILALSCTKSKTENPNGPILENGRFFYSKNFTHYLKKYFKKTDAGLKSFWPRRK